MSDPRIPTESDWRSEPWTLDVPYAYRHFFGKNLVEAFDLFVENAVYYQEGVMFMPLTCFRYYLHAYIDYLLSEVSAGDSDGANCFFGLVECRKDDINGSGEVLQRRVRDVLTRLRNWQRWHDAEPEVFGDFKVRANEALRLIERSARDPFGT